METQQVPATIPELPQVSIPPPEWSNRRLFSLLWPLLIEQLLIVLVGLIDMAMVSSVGEHAVSGISLVDSINFLFITAFNAMATGGSVVASQYIGRGDPKNARAAARQLVYISVIISLFLMAFTMTASRPMLSLIYGNIAEDVMRSAQIYFLITALSYPFLALYTSSAALFRSMGKSKTTMRISLLINIINVSGNAFFIFVLKWGVAGAAAATLICRIAGAVISVLLLTHNWTYLINIKGITKVKLDGKMIRRILNVGVPSGLEASMFQVGKILVTRIFTVFGTAAIAANAVASTINSMAFMPGSAYGMGLLIVVGQCIGARDYEGAKKYTKKIMKLSYITYFAINLNILIFMNSIIGIFNLSYEAHRLCVTFLRIHLVTSTLFWCPSFVLPNALKAAGDARFVMIVAICTMWLVRVCSAFLMAFTFGLGPAAVSVAMGMDFLFRGLFFSRRWLKEKWKTKKVI